MEKLEKMKVTHGALSHMRDQLQTNRDHLKSDEEILSKSKERTQYQLHNTLDQEEKIKTRHNYLLNQIDRKFFQIRVLKALRYMELELINCPLACVSNSIYFSNLERASAQNCYPVLNLT